MLCYYGVALNKWDCCSLRIRPVGAILGLGLAFVLRVNFKPVFHRVFIAFHENIICGLFLDWEVACDVVDLR